MILLLDSQLEEVDNITPPQVNSFDFIPMLL